MYRRETINQDNLTTDRALRFLYKNPFGRIILRGVTLPFISKIVGAYMNSPFSRIRIKRFIDSSGINIEEYEQEDYRSFNDCFTRKIKEGTRPFPRDRALLCSPCDSKVSAYKISDDTVLPVKGSSYTISQLLNNSRLAEKYNGGSCVVFRLAVDDYHRYVYIDSGTKEENIKITGKLHTVQPIALNISPVFIQNSREYTLMHTDNFGDVVQVEVGALMVGRIKNHMGKGKILRGEEKGMFLFGGSTVILLLQHDRAEVDAEFFENTAKGLETIVKMGEPIGKKL